MLEEDRPVGYEADRPCRENIDVRVDQARVFVARLFVTTVHRRRQGASARGTR